MLIPPITLAFFICVVVCVGPFLSAVHLLLALVVPVFGWPVPVRFSCGFLFLVLRGSSLSLLLLGVLLWLFSFC